MKSGLVLNKIRKVSRLGEFKVSEALNRFEFNIDGEWNKFRVLWT